MIKGLFYEDSVNGMGFYEDVDFELSIDTTKSEYLKIGIINHLRSAHILEVYLHGIAGTQGEKGGTPYKSDIPQSIWNQPLTRWVIPQPKFAAKVGVSESDTPQGTRPVYNPSWEQNNPYRQNMILGNELPEIVPSSGNHLTSLKPIFNLF
ncbi:hypothetical protein BC332_04635 [Capsicum chinense]|nr:hypothetical protein BC332_04635 [Capsicum chinense]